MKNLFAEMGGKEHTGGLREDWMVAVEGIVADTADPLSQHRVKVIIPVIDENVVYDEWVTALMPWVGPAGYGPVHLPEPGTEVVLFGRLGQKHTLFYVSRYNEDILPPDLGGARGLKTDTAYKLLADLFIHFISQQAVLVQAATQADVKAPLVRLMGNENEVVRVEPSKIGFLGASAIARRTLPGPATDLTTNNALTNAIRQLLIDVGLAQ